MSLGDRGRRERMQAMLRELELRADEARRHEQRMGDALAESTSWGEPADRAWIERTAMEASGARERAEHSLRAGRALVGEAFPGLHPEAARNAIARCSCGATWVLPVRAVRRTLHGIYAHTPGALICSVCGNTAALDAAPAPQPDRPPEGADRMTPQDQIAGTSANAGEHCLPCPICTSEQPAMETRP